MHGHERRDHIRRKVNEAQVLKEVEKQELEGVSMNS